MNIRLIAIDIDGTAVNSRHQLDTRTLDAISAAIKQGITVVPTTGRPYSSVPAALLNMPSIRYVITSNGADMLDMDTNQSIYSRYLSGDEALNITRRLSRHELYLYIHSAGKHYELKGAADPFEKIITGTGNEFIRFQVDDLNTFISEHKTTIEKVGGICFDQTTYHEILNEEKRFGNINMASSGALSIEFNSPDASKGNALSFLCGRLGISARDVMVLGDNQNDVSMFEFAGYSVAMGNGIDELKSIASKVTKSCDDFGAAIAIEQMLKCQNT